MEYEKLVGPDTAEASEHARKRVDQARETQRKRFQDQGFLSNSEMGPAEVWKSCPLDDSAKGLLQAATQRLSLSARAFHRILKVSRTIAGRSAGLTAGPDGAEDIGLAHLAEALRYRPRQVG